MKPTTIKRKILLKSNIELKGDDIIRRPGHLQIIFEGGHISMPLGDSETWSNVRDMFLDLFEVAAAREVLEKHKVKVVKEGKE